MVTVRIYCKIIPLVVLVDRNDETIEEFIFYLNICIQQEQEKTRSNLNVSLNYKCILYIIAIISNLSVFPVFFHLIPLSWKS